MNPASTVTFLTLYIVGRIANGKEIQLWVHGIKIGDQWQFHDGSRMP